MKRILIIIMAVSLLMFYVSGCSESTDETANDGNIIKIGIYEPTQGDNSDGGKKETLGIRYAHSLKDVVTLNGKEYKIKLVESDSSSDSTSAAAFLISENVSAVIGSYSSDDTVNGLKSFEKAGIPVVCCSCTVPSITENNEYCFRICYTDPFQGSVMASYAKSSGVKTAYVLTQKDDIYSSSLGTYFKKAFEALGGTVIYEVFPEETTDFTSYISNAKSRGVDAIFVPTSTAKAEYIIKQSYENDATYKLIAGNSWDSAVILNASKETDLDISISTFFDEDDNRSYDFVNGYKSWLSSDIQLLTDNGGSNTVSSVTALGYDAYNLIISSIEKANSADTDKIADTLYTSEFDGVTGSIKFESSGDAIKESAYIKRVDTVNGCFGFVKIQTVR